MSTVERKNEHIRIEIERQEFREADPDRLVRVCDPDVFLRVCDGGLAQLRDGAVHIRLGNGRDRYVSHNALVDILQTAKAETPFDGDVPPKKNLEQLKEDYEQEPDEGPRQ